MTVVVGALDRALDEVVDRVCVRTIGVEGPVRVVVAGEVDAVAPLLGPAERDLVIARAVARLDGLDALDEILRDDAVDEVMVNAGGEIWVDRCGRLERGRDLAPGAVDVVLERVLAPLGKRLDRTSPIVDARLPDGGRVCAVVAPIAPEGTTLAIRRHRRHRIPIERFADREVARMLLELIERRCNVLVTGATSSGKTTLLSALLDHVSATERLVVIEDTSELVLAADRHAVRLEARPAATDGLAAIDLARLVRTALRLRPDRLVLGEFRGPEVVAVIEALNTGHDGSLSTCHANSSADGLRRIETLVMQAAPSWPLAAIRRQVSGSIDAIVHVTRRPDGSRSVSEVAEVIESDHEPEVRPLARPGVVLSEPTRARR